MRAAVRLLRIAEGRPVEQGLNAGASKARLLVTSVRTGRAARAALPAWQQQQPRNTPTQPTHQRQISSVVGSLTTLIQEPEVAKTAAAGISFGGFEYTPSEQVVQFLSVAPPILLQCVFFSPLQAVKQFRDQRTTGDVSIMPYTMMVANGTIWFSYGAVLSNPTIMLPNITAIVMGIGYCATFLKYRSPQAVLAPFIGSSAGIVGVTVGSATMLPAADAQNVIGYLGCGVCAAMFGGPLASMKAVLRDQSAASIPIGFTLFSTVNTSVWLGYGAIVLGDPFIWAPNVLGLGSSITQIGLIARFGTAPPPKAQPPPAEAESPVDSDASTKP